MTMDTRERRIAIRRRLDCDSNLGIVIPYFNAFDYQSLKRNVITTLSQFSGRLLQHVMVAECVVGDAPAFADTLGVDYIQTFSRSILWHKEQLLNVAFQHLIERGYAFVAWIDGDVLFLDQSWYSKLFRTLRRARAAAVFEKVYRLGDVAHEDFERVAFPYNFHRHQQHPAGWGESTSGFGWGYRAQTLEKAGWLYPFHILGRGDAVAWYGLNDLGDEKDDVPHIRRWRMRFYEAFEKDFWWNEGVNIVALPHCSDKGRAYIEKRGKLREFGFDPDRDLITNPSGALEFSDNCTAGLRDYVEAYFANRRD